MRKYRRVAWNISRSRLWSPTNITPMQDDSIQDVRFPKEGREKRESVKWTSSRGWGQTTSLPRRDKLWKRERSNESYSLIYIYYSYVSFSYNRIPSLEYLDYTLCNCDGSLNLNEQQSTRKRKKKRRKNHITFVSS